MFASLIIERPELDWSQMPAVLPRYVQDSGTLMAVVLVVFGIVYALRRPEWIAPEWNLAKRLLLGTALLSAACYAIFFVLLSIQGLVSTPNPDPRLPPLTDYHPAQAFLLTLAGACAYLAVAWPMLLDVGARHFSGRRIWALARLSLKEAWRRGIVWICLIIPVIYLYADYFLPAKAEDQLLSRVKVAYFSLSLLFVVTAVLLGSFSIPADVKNQTIHTIVTKPVQRYEIVLGRFLGYALLMLVELTALTLLSLIYVIRGLTPEAVEEGYHARVPLFGTQLAFHGTSKTDRGESVGREWDYRSYIAGPALHTERPDPQYAIWFFQDVPAALSERTEPARLEFTFDIFRTTKGIENKGVFCTFTFAPGHLSPAAIKAELTKVKEERAEKTKESKGDLNKINADLLEKYGVLEISGVEVTDYHTQSLEVPPGIFKKLRADAANKPAVDKESKTHALQVLINVERTPGSSTQMIGVARRDLYLLVGDNPFWFNFIKGSLAIWLGACLVLGIAVTASTYLSGTISFLVTCFLCGAGLFSEYILSVAEGRSEGGREGGTIASMVRLFNRQNINAALDKTAPSYTVIIGGDDVVRWVMRLLMKIIPDVMRYDLATYVANGFDISLEQLLLLDNLLPLLGYLTPCIILGYYLMKSREIANPM